MGLGGRGERFLGDAADVCDTLQCSMTYRPTRSAGVCLLLIGLTAAVSACRDPQLDWTANNPRQPAWQRPAVAQEPPPSPESAAERVQAGILVAGSQTLSIDELIAVVEDGLRVQARSVRSGGGVGEFAGLVQRFVPYAEMLVNDALVYQEAMARLPSTPEARARLDAALDQLELEQITRMTRDRVVFYERMAELGLSREQYRMMLRRQVLARQFVLDRITNRLQVSRARMLEDYQRRIDAFRTPGSAQLWAIGLPVEPADDVSARAAARGQAMAVRSRLAGQLGADAASEVLPGLFEAAAREVSRHPTARAGGRLHMREPLLETDLRSERPADGVWQAVVEEGFDLAPWTLSEPIDKPGWVVLLLAGEARPRSVVPFSEAIAVIEPRLRAELSAGAEREYVAGLRRRHGIGAEDLEAFSRQAVARLGRLGGSGASGAGR